MVLARRRSVCSSGLYQKPHGHSRPGHFSSSTQGCCGKDQYKDHNHPAPAAEEEGNYFTFRCHRLLISFSGSQYPSIVIFAFISLHIKLTVTHVAGSRKEREQRCREYGVFGPRGAYLHF